MSSLCEICLHFDEQMEYSNGGVITVPICMFNRPNFGLVKRYDQCRDFTNTNQGASDADTDIPVEFFGSARGGDNRSGAASPD
jgi:hypothetical protein